MQPDLSGLLDYGLHVVLAFFYTGLLFRSDSNKDCEDGGSAQQWLPSQMHGQRFETNGFSLVVYTKIQGISGQNVQKRCVVPWHHHLWFHNKSLV